MKILACTRGRWKGVRLNCILCRELTAWYYHNLPWTRSLLPTWAHNVIGLKPAEVWAIDLHYIFWHIIEVFTKKTKKQKAVLHKYSYVFIFRVADLLVSVTGRIVNACFFLCLLCQPEFTVQIFNIIIYQTDWIIFRD